MTSLQDRFIDPDKEIGRLKEEEDKKINEQYKDITNPKDPNLLGSQLLDNITASLTGIGQSIVEASQDDPDEWTDDAIRLGLSGAENVGNVLNAPGIKQALQALGAPAWVVGQGLGWTLEKAGVDPRYGHIAGEVGDWFIPFYGAGKLVKAAGGGVKRVGALIDIARGGGMAANVGTGIDKGSNLGKRLTNSIDNLYESTDNLPFLPSGGKKTETGEYIDWLKNISTERKYINPKAATLSADMAFPELIEPGKALRRNNVAKLFPRNKEFQAFIADYLNQNYLWRKTHNDSLKGFSPGRVIIDPKGNAWYWTKTGFRNVSKDKAYVSFRNTARAINVTEVQDQFIELLPNLPPATAIQYADKYLEFNKSAKRQLVKWIKRENQRAGKTVIDLDHITALEEWEGTGADIFFNLQPLDLGINRSIGKKAREEWKDLNLALGSVKNIKQDIILWLDKFGPEGAKSGELWNFFRNMSSEDRKILWNAVIIRRIPVNEALEQMKFGNKLFQLDLFNPDPKPIGNAGIWKRKETTN